MTRGGFKLSPGQLINGPCFRNRIVAGDRQHRHRLPLPVSHTHAPARFTGATVLLALATGAVIGACVASWWIALVILRTP